MAIQVDEDYEVRNWRPSPTTLLTAFAATSLILAAGRNEDYVKPSTTPAIAATDERIAPVIAVYTDRGDASRQLIQLRISAGNEDYVYPLATPSVLNETEWSPLRSWGVSVPPIQFLFNDEPVPQASAFVFEEDGLIPVLVQKGLAPQQLFNWNDEVVPQATSFVFEEDSWTVPTVWPQLLPQAPSKDDSDYVYPLATPAVLGEAEWPLNSFAQVWKWTLFNDDNDVPLLFGVQDDSVQAPLVLWNNKLVVSSFIYNDDIVPVTSAAFEEDAWIVPNPWAVSRLVQVSQYNDEFVFHAVASIVAEEDSWIIPTIWSIVRNNGSLSIVTEDDLVVTTSPIVPPLYPILVGCAGAFNQYYTLVDKFCVYNMALIPVSFAFIRPSNCALPYVRFVDDNPFYSAPRVEVGDWLDVYIDNSNGSSLVKSFQYLGHNDPQTYLIKVPCGSFVTVKRNSRYHKIHTTPNTFNANEAAKWGVNVARNRRSS